MERGVEERLVDQRVMVGEGSERRNSGVGGGCDERCERGRIRETKVGWREGGVEVERTVEGGSKGGVEGEGRESRIIGVEGGRGHGRREDSSTDTRASSVFAEDMTRNICPRDVLGDN